MRPLPNATDMEYYENLIYLPMLLTILSKDREKLSGVKLEKPYHLLIDKALSLVQMELKKTHDYARQNHMKLVKGKMIGEFTEYIFFYKGYEDTREYANVRLRNRTSELIEWYFAEAMLRGAYI